MRRPCCLPGINIVFLVITIKCANTLDLERINFTAAVYDSVPVLYYDNGKSMSREEALKFIQDNYLVVYEEQVANAKSQNADIIVFAEYGLLPLGATYNRMEPFLEEIPYPETDSWNPCTEPDKYQDTEVQRTLSCLARNHSIYLVANMGEVEYIDKSGDNHCSGAKRCQYNVNIVYDPTGKLVAKYRKANLFWEFRYDTPTTTDYTYFDTPFGRFGTFICFDLLFKEPPITLIEEYKIDHIVFPTAWMNVYPYFSAVPFHQGFAIGTGVNFLSSNLHYPEDRFSGSGIYSATTTLAYRNDYSSDDGALLVASLQSKPDKVTVQPTVFNADIEDKSTFQSEVFGDDYNFVAIEEQEGEFYVCHNHLCCYLNYRAKESTFNEHFAFGAFRGLHTNEGTYYIEVCLFFKCANSSQESCGEWVFDSETIFDRFNLTGNFSTPYVFPEVVTDNINPAPGEWTFDGSYILSNGVSTGLVSTTLFARRYDLDDSSDDSIYTDPDVQSTTPYFSTASLIAHNKTMLLLGVICTVILYARVHIYQSK